MQKKLIAVFVLYSVFASFMLLGAKFQTLFESSMNEFFDNIENVCVQV